MAACPRPDKVVRYFNIILSADSVGTCHRCQQMLNLQIKHCTTVFF